MKKILLFITMICFSAILCAKDHQKNSIKFFGNNFIYPEIYERQYIKEVITVMPRDMLMRWGQIGFSYQREINRKWSLEIGRYKWNNTAWFNMEPPGGSKILFLSNDATKIGIRYRNNLKFFDVSVGYSKIVLFKPLGGLYIL